MNRFLHAGLIAGAMLSVAALSAPAHALDVSQVQLAIADSGGASCPRDATVTAYAHTDGPGTVKFVIRNDSGGKTGELSATAVKGPAGNFLATYKQTFKITTDVDIKYMAEAIGHGKISNWVAFKATCGPQVRTKTSTKASDAKPPVKKSSDDGPQPRTKTSTKKSDAAPPAKKADKDDGKPATKPASGGKPIPNAGKPVADCKPRLSVTRTLAVTRTGGIATAQATWQSTALAAYGAAYSRWSNAKNQSTSCDRKGLTFDCTVAADPCS